MLQTVTYIGVRLSQSSLHGKESKIVLDFVFHAVDSGFQVLDLRFLAAGTWIPHTNRQWIPESLSCIPDSKVRISDFTSKDFPKAKSLGFRISLHVSNKLYSSYFNCQWILIENSCWPTISLKRVGPIAINIQRIVCILTMARNIFILKIRESRLLVVHERHNTAISCRHQDTLYLKNAHSSYLFYLINSDHDYTNNGNHHMLNCLEALTVSVC